MSWLVTTRYPVLVRFGALFVCVILATAIAKGPVSALTVVVTVGAVCLAVPVLAYRAEIDAKEVRVRYAPFYTRHTPIRNVVTLAEETTLVLVTATSRIPLWGLSPKAREVLFQGLPHHLDVVPARPCRQSDAAVSIRRHKRLAILAALAFAASAAFSVPFLRRNPWNGYVNTIGKSVMFTCLCAFVLMVFEAGFTWVLWATKRDIDRIDGGHVRRKG